jgi:hypothetical protein
VTVVLTGEQNPLQFELVDVAALDFGQRTVAPAVIGATNRKPVAVFRLLQSIRCDGLVVLKNRAAMGQQPVGLGLRQQVLVRQRPAPGEWEELADPLRLAKAREATTTATVIRPSVLFMARY